jgi:hypothetical protein
MLRALFFAIGAFVALTGGGLFVVDSVVLTDAAHQTLSERIPLSFAAREIDPPAWLPYTCSSCGILTMLYALALPRRAK